MAMNKITEVEYKAINKKLNNPQEDVSCPRCGKKLLYKKIGNSISIECETEDCIYGGIRGL